jgi:putative sugar O-methyltransferase
MWDEINGEFFGKNRFDIFSFRQPGQLNSRLASWEPGERSLRWYRTFLNLAFSSSSIRVQSNLENLLTRMDLGNPVSNNQKGRKNKIFSFNLDYILAFEELEYLENSIENILEFKNIIEIGAGFGRTAHVIIERIEKLESYVIYDLPEMLEVSRVYLQAVLQDSQFKKITFTSSIDFVKSEHFDLGIQIDGFQEMQSETIDEIYSRFLSNSTFVYLKNPVGKYLPTSAGLEVELLNVPLGIGRSLGVLDIWNLSEIELQIKNHLEIYRPALHVLLHSQPDRLFPHYIHSVYWQDQEV